MCIQIDSRCVLFNMLQAREHANLSSLQSFVTAVKVKINRSYVDISDASVFAVIEANPSIFFLEGKTVRRGNDFERFAEKGFLDQTINRHLPEEVRKVLHECASTVH